MKTFWKNGQEAPSEKEPEAGRTIKKKRCAGTIFLSTFKDSDDVTMQWA
jgi:hypothetical protein